MALSPVLHPSVRERLEPRMSATALAEYLILQPDHQERILQDSKFSSAPVVGANGDAMRALCAYNCDPRRNRGALESVKSALWLRSIDTSERPKRRDEATRCIEAINLFEQQENALGMRSLLLKSPPRFDALIIEGVELSIRPNFLVGGPNNHVGAAILRVAKAPDPEACKMDEMRRRRGDHRREMGRYMVAMLQMLLEAQGGQSGIPDRNLCFVADVRIGERIGPADDHFVRLRSIRGACAQIAKLWPRVEPRRSLLKK
jgi:hypothetical protein